MSHFYATLQGNRSPATRCGSQSSGVHTNAAGWNGCVSVSTYFDAETGRDMARVWLGPWQNSGGSRFLIAVVELDAVDGMVYYPPMGGRRKTLRRGILSRTGC